MRIHFFYKLFGCIALLFLSLPSFSDAYKWVDAEGEIHYTQQDPRIIPAKKIDPPPPPAIDPVAAQKEIDILIEKQNGTYEENEKERQRIAKEAAEKKKKEEYCRINKHNLQLFQDNPSRRVVAPDGTVTRITEELRQQKIDEFTQNIMKHCQ
ncbi:MAG: DUF4124 domain-containing protein [Gammaproteobacteria bacterium]|nr:DUF4124 domain-containing protein [Gammaproteobacteria bacterium]